MKKDRDALKRIINAAVGNQSCFWSPMIEGIKQPNERQERRSMPARKTGMI